MGREWYGMMALPFKAKLVSFDSMFNGMRRSPLIQRESNIAVQEIMKRHYNKSVATTACTKYIEEQSCRSRRNLREGILSRQLYQGAVKASIKIYSVIAKSSN
jgi:hypothetical protein